MWVYLQNRFVLEKEAKVSVFDRGFLYGDGLFETVRAYRGKIFLLSRHLDRLADAARQLSLASPQPKKLERALYDTLRRNRLHDALLRITLTRGWGYGIDPTPCTKTTLVIFAKPFLGPSDNLYRRGITGATVSLRSQDAFRGQFKAISFLGSVLAKQEALSKGAVEPILLNTKGYLTESATSNLFWVHHGGLYTPDVKTGILAGITRRVVIERAHALTIPVHEGFYRKEALLNAEEAFLTNTGFELMPIVQINHKKIGTGRPGPITKQIHKAFRARVEEQINA